MNTLADDRALTCSATMKTMISLLPSLHASKTDVGSDFLATLLPMTQRPSSEQYVLLSEISTPTNKKCHTFCAEHTLSGRSTASWQGIDARNRRITSTRRCTFGRLLKVARTASQQPSLSLLIKRPRIISDESDETREKSGPITLVSIRAYCFNA